VRPEERATRRVFMRVARVLIGAVILVSLAGAALWLRASLYPWTDHDLPGARSLHAVLHLQNDSGAPFTLAWRRAGSANSSPGPWIELPPIPSLPTGVVEARGFRLLSPLLAEAAPEGSPAGVATPIELRLTLAGEELHLLLTARAGDHLRLRLDATRALHLQTGHANWLGVPDFGDEHPASMPGAGSR